MIQNEFTIAEAFNILKNRWKTIVIITLFTTIISTILCYFVITPKYKSTIKVFIGKESGYTKEYSIQDVQLYKELAISFGDLVCTDNLVNNALAKSNIDVDEVKVISNLSTKTNQNSQILEISYQNNDPELCKKILEAITDEFILEAHQLVKSVDMEVVSDAKLPISPISPDKKLFVAAGVLLGIILSILLIFIQDITMTDKESNKHLVTKH